MGNKFEKLNHNDVVSVNRDNFERLDVSSTLKALELIAAIKEDVGSNNREAKLFEDGMECEVLRPGADGWKKGKVRFVLEFCPDEPENNENQENEQLDTSQKSSPLDDLRKQLKEAEN
jgi:hypothetical protein